MSRIPTLSPDKIVATVDRLRARISERFATSSLLSLCDELTVVARQAQGRAIALAQPIWGLRVLIAVVIGLGAAAFIAFAPEIVLPDRKITLYELAQVMESAVNDVLLVGAGLFFLFSWEIRVKRNRALRALHELRSLAHIIDMHQLTKDPEKIAGKSIRTSSSPQQLAPTELGRYLDYCSEMLSLTGKIAALYAEELNDPVVLAAVNEIESLTNGFSRKIWQKIMIIHATPPPSARA